VRMSQCDERRAIAKAPPDFLAVIGSAHLERADVSDPSLHPSGGVGKAARSPFDRYRKAYRARKNESAMECTRCWSTLSAV
jgi:hypothetical protein